MMDEQRKVVSMRRFKAKRRLVLLKRLLGLPAVLISMLFVFGIISAIQPTDSNQSLLQGFKEAKAGLMQFNSDPVATEN